MPQQRQRLINQFIIDNLYLIKVLMENITKDQALADLIVSMTFYFLHTMSTYCASINIVIRYHWIPWKLFLFCFII